VQTHGVRTINLERAASLQMRKCKFLQMGPLRQTNTSQQIP
jgi:hypothetical protein